jgi:hypothetical protein
MRVEISIRRMHVHGIPVASARHLTASLEHELARLVAERGVPAALVRDARLRRLRSPDMPTFVETDKGLGRGIARIVYGSLERMDRPATARVPSVGADTNSS